jgi:hypothetical protein
MRCRLVPLRKVQAMTALLVILSLASVAAQIGLAAFFLAR